MNIGIGEPEFPSKVIQDEAAKLLEELVSRTEEGKLLETLSCIDISVWNGKSDPNAKKRHRYFERYRRIEIEVPLNYKNFLSLDEKLAVWALVLVSLKELDTAFDKFGWSHCGLMKAIDQIELDAEIARASAYIRYKSTSMQMCTSKSVVGPMLLQFVLTLREPTNNCHQFDEIAKKIEKIFDSSEKVIFESLDRFDDFGFAMAVCIVNEPSDVMQVSRLITHGILDQISGIDVRVENVEGEVIYSGIEDGLQILGG